MIETRAASRKEQRVASYTPGMQGACVEERYDVRKRMVQKPSTTWQGSEKDNKDVKTAEWGRYR